MNEFDTWLFDCDGVILDSNTLKTEAFRRVGLAYGETDAEALVRYHLQHGGVSRYQKLDFFFREIRHETGFEDKLQAALTEYASIVSEGLRRCPEVPGAREFLERLGRAGNVSAFVISGSDEKELRGVFDDRGLSRYFDGIFGSPATKRDIVSALSRANEDHVRRPLAVLCGDSRLDYEVAMECGITFIMVYGHTEWNGWREAIPRDTVCVGDFRELAKLGGLV